MNGGRTLDRAFTRVQPERVGHIADFSWAYRLTLLMGLMLIGAFLSVLFHVTTVAGGSVQLGAVVLAAFGLGVVLARQARPTVGVAAIAVLFGLGLGGYLLAIPNLVEAILTLELIVDTVALLLGDMSLLQLFRADLWTAMMAPAPVYGTWYLLLRRRYGLSVWVGGAALLFVVLTGDASETVTLVGATGALGVLGFGTVERFDASWQRIQEVGILLVGVVILTRLSRPVFAKLFPPSTGAASGETAGPQAGTLEGSLIETTGRVPIQGSMSLSPTVRFTVTADEPERWQTGAYDRFTGRGWVRTGVETPYQGSLPAPFGQTRSLKQQFTAESSIAAMPAAWRPVSVDEDVADRTLVTELGGLQASEPFEPGESYTVTSERPVSTAKQLQSVEGEVSGQLRRQYLQLPADTPARIGRFAADLTSEAETRLEQAIQISRWLTGVKRYSLDIDRPSGNIADAFIFEMEAGYCTYFATAMIVMLRTLGVPARMAVGYMTGQSIGGNQWEIRGLNSHAWVQVYFDQFGWVALDPTPGEARREARVRQLEREGVSVAPDAAGVGFGAGTPTPSPTTGADEPTGADDRASIPTADGGGRTPELFGADQPDGVLTQPGTADPAGFTRRSLFTGLSDVDRVSVLAGIVGVALGVNRLGLLSRAAQTARVRWQAPTASPQQDIERAFERLEWVLARQHPARAPGETRRQYIDTLTRSDVDDDRLERVLERYQQARYQGDVSREGADEVIRLVDDVVRDYRSPGASIRRILLGDR